MMIACTLLASIFAFALFGLATDRHHETRLARRCSRHEAARLRGAAWALVALAMLCGWAAWGPVYGAIATLGMLMLGAGVTFLALNLLPPHVAAKQSAKVTSSLAATHELNLTLFSSPRA